MRVNEVVVGSRERITPYYSLPAVDRCSLSRERREQHSNHEALGQAVWLSVGEWGRVA